MMRCKICGYVFDESKKTQTCEFCMESDCNMVRCPNCGYENLPESEINLNVMDFLKKKFRSQRR